MPADLMEHETEAAEHNTVLPQKRIGNSLIPGVLFLFLLGIFFYGAHTIFAKVKKPFDFPEATITKGSISDLLNQETEEDPDRVRLKTLDTDNDTLTDYDELFVFRTSPYIADSDSDGYKDAEELSKGYDPNCPAGKDCFGADDLKTEKKLLSDFKSEDGLQQIEKLRNVAPDEIRQLLKEKKGYTDEQLNAIDDKTLVEFYQKSLDEAARNAEVETQQSVDPTILNPYSMTPDQVRDMVRKSGLIPEDQLKTINDTTLMGVFQEALKKKEAEERL